LHITYINAVIDTHDYDLARRYTDEIKEQLLTVSNVIRTPHPIISAVLTEEKKKAENEGITVSFNIAITDDMKMSSADLGIVLGNLYANAIEACRINLNKEQRFIKLSLLQNERSLLIEMENGYVLPTTNFQSPRRHGYGTKNIRKVVDKYDGYYSMEATGELYRVRIIIP